MSEVTEKVRLAKAASRAFGLLDTTQKNHLLSVLADTLIVDSQAILDANQFDLNAMEGSLSDALLDRLRLNEKRIQDMAVGVRQIIELPDPVGEILERIDRPNGLEILKKRVPLGVIAIIYESRPNVTIDAAALCLKSGNAVVLRGGKEALRTNLALIKTIHASFRKCGLDPDTVQFIEDPDRGLARELMRSNGYIDALIPRGSARLIQSVIENATLPVIETGTGNCHIYVEKSADLHMAEAILMNAKTSRPGVCNAAEKCLVDASIARKFLSQIMPKLRAKNVEIRGDEAVCALDPSVIPADEIDWSTEYLDLILGIKIVSGFDEAIKHIQTYSTQHSEAIVTSDTALADRFMNEIDAAAVYVNASTRFTDGFEFGFGAEIGISTQKLHARGPMGLKELTTYKYLIYGNGQIR